MFMGPFDQAISWSTDGLVGARRFLERVWRLNAKCKNQNPKSQLKIQNSRNKELETLLHQTIKKVTEDIENLRFNTAVSALMILANAFDKEPSITRADFETFLKLLAPFAPHISDELWAALGNKKSIHQSAWPLFDENALYEAERVVIVQVNGKVRGQFSASPALGQDKALAEATSLPSVSRWLFGKVPRVARYIPGRLLSIVTQPE
jgi:leucyl-tRNA synthetase